MRLPLRVKFIVADEPAASTPDVAEVATPDTDSLTVDVDLDWQPEAPRLTFVEGRAPLDALGLGALQLLDALPDDDSRRVVEALRAGKTVTLELRARD